MAKIIDSKINMPKSEAYVYDAIVKNLPDDIVAYHNRIVSGLEFDYCLLIKNVGLVVIEVKGWEAKNIIKVVSPDEIYTDIYEKPVTSPKKQARGYKFNLVNFFNNKYNLNPLVMDMVSYPFISENEYSSIGLNIVSEAETTLFKEDLDDSKRFSQKILNAYRQLCHGSYDKTVGKNYETIRKYFEVEYTLTESNILPYSELRVYPNVLTISEIDEVLNAYFKGIKQILFVCDKDTFYQLKVNLEKKLNLTNVLAVKNDFVIQSNVENKIECRELSFSVFNFDCFCTSDIKTHFREKILIKNGNVENESRLKLLSELSGFNYQQYLIEHADVKSNIHIKAGAGTGKTYSMISRISYICNIASNSGVLDPSEDIAMLTFTSEAATNMKKRLKSQFMNYFILTKDCKYLTLVDGVERMQISTIHSFAKNVISNTSLPLGIGTNFVTVSGQYQRKKIFRRIFNEYLQEINKDDATFLFNLPINMYDLENKLLQISEMLYNKGFDVKTSSIKAFGSPIIEMPYFLDLIENVVKKAEIEYAQMLFDNNSVNLSEYMVYLNKCIADDSFNANLYKYKYVFVDEFQDVDDAQIVAFLKMQEKLKFYFFIVGDLKQSIYRFRGATMDAFSKMGCESDKWISFGLNTNYRSDKNLLRDYDILFSYMGKTKLIPYVDGEDTLHGIKNNNEDGDLLLNKISYTLEDEKNDEFYRKVFDVVCARKRELEEKMRKKSLSSAERTIAILVRTNKQISEILNKAKKFNVVIESDSSGDLYRLPPAIDLCKLTSALTHPYSPVYLFDLIVSNNVNIDFSVDSIVGLSDEQKIEVLVDCLNEYYKSVMGLTWQELIHSVYTKPILMMLRKIYESTKPWKAESDIDEKQLHYRTNYDLLFEDLARLNKRAYLTLDSINEDLHISITTGTDVSSRELLDDSDYVKIICTTVHGSKGLEYDSVILPFTDKRMDKLSRNSLEITCVNNKVGYLINLTQNPMVNEYFITDNEIQENKMEEARILYVALTRAINRFTWFEKVGISGITWGNVLEEMIKCQ